MMDTIHNGFDPIPRDLQPDKRAYDAFIAGRITAASMIGPKDADELRSYVRSYGKRFFNASTMRFFNSRLCGGCDALGFFVTSERFGFDAFSPRLYTVRRLRIGGEVETVGKFQAYATLKQARAAIRNLRKEML